jgi:N-acetylmuramoyl-L-alanine amidase
MAEPPAMRRRGTVALCAVGLVAPLLAPLLAAGPSSAAAPVRQESAVTPVVHEVAVSPRVGRSSGAMGGSAAGRESFSTPAQPVSGLGLVGVTWLGPQVEGVRFALRTDDGDGWSGWQALQTGDCHEGCGDAESSLRSGTTPALVGRVDRVQLRVVAPTGALPEDLRLSVIDPGEMLVEEGGAGTTRGASTMRAGDDDGPERPRIRKRTRWGADERMRSGSPSYGRVEAGFVHHTVNSNGYRRRDVPAIIRGIYAYHTRSLGWSDIGYNFLVDRFGRIWEGRYGGIGRRVIGAHTYGYNDDAFGVSAIGNFEEVRARKKLRRGIARLLAWKLDRHGVRARGKADLDGDIFRKINGHRDAGQTACPGEHLYEKMRLIRRRAVYLQRH